jgi:hypothetical protein
LEEIYMDDVKIKPEIVSKLTRKIILSESMNLYTKEYNDVKMVSRICNMIEEEVKCNSNQ